MAPSCSTCQDPLHHLAGRAVIRLYRCAKCGEQQMLPGDPELSAQAPSVAAPPEAPPQKKGFFAKLFGG